MDLDEILRRFDAEYCEMHSISPGRRHQQEVLLRRLAESLDHPITELSVADVNAFVGAELRRGLHPNTGRKYIGMLKSFARWGGSNGILRNAAELELLRNPRGSSAQNKPRPYTMREIADLRRAVAETYPVLPVRGPGSQALKMYAIGKKSRIRRHLWSHVRRLQLDAQIALALELGLRRVELFRVTIAEIHPDNTFVVVRTAKAQPGEYKTRAVPFTTHARQTIEEWLDLRAILGPPHDRPWLAMPRLGTAVEQMRPQTLEGLRDALLPVGTWTWHRLRHTCATEWLRAGLPLEKVRVLLGHARIEQTLAYAEILDSDIETAVQAAEAAFSKRLGTAA